MHEIGFFVDKDISMWKISAKWANKIIQCDLSGIKICGAGCCKCKTFWPVSAFGDDGCVWLGDKGCTLEIKDRPITCLLYPFVLNENKTLVLYGRALLNSVCVPVVNSGTKIVFECFSEVFCYLFGEKQYLKSVELIKSGQDVVVTVPKYVDESWENEKLLKENNTKWLKK